MEYIYIYIYIYSTLDIFTMIFLGSDHEISRYLMVLSQGCIAQAHYQSSYVQVFRVFTVNFTLVELTQPGLG